MGSKNKRSFVEVYSVSFPALFLVLAAILIATNVEKALLTQVQPDYTPAFMAVTPFNEVAGVILAQSGPGTGGGSGPGGASGGLQNPLKFNTLSEFLEGLLTVVIQIGYLVAVFFIIYSGYKFVTAQGNPKEIEDAKKMLLWTVIGTAILIGAHVISAAIKATVDSLSS